MVVLFCLFRQTLSKMVCTLKGVKRSSVFKSGKHFWGALLLRKNVKFFQTFDCAVCQVEEAAAAAAPEKKKKQQYRHWNCIV